MVKTYNLLFYHKCPLSYVQMVYRGRNIASDLNIFVRCSTIHMMPYIYMQRLN